MGAKGAFILSQINNKQLSTPATALLNTSTGVLRQVSNSWDLGSDGTYGLFGGGSGPASTVDRIDFSNDSPATASVRGPLTVARTGLAATGNANYAWFVGGLAAGSPPPVLSTVDRVDFANDSPTTASPRGPLSSARNSLSATGNANFGWIGGGGGGSVVDRIDFSNDSPATASVRGPLSLARFGLSATSNANYGWFSGGYTPFPGSLRSTVDRIDYSNDNPTAASLRGPLTVARYNVGAAGNANYGWVSGGATVTAPTIFYSTVDRIDYSNDSPTAASPRGPLSIGRIFPTATANANFGWFGGGQAPAAAPAVLSTVDRIDFANDTTAASPRGPLSVARTGIAATSNYVKSVPSTQYPTQGLGTNEALAGYGWFTAGSPSVGVLSVVDRIDFANDSPTTASPRASLTAVRYLQSTTSNANYGWNAGGRNPALTPNFITLVDRIDFSNDLATPSVRGSLSVATHRAAGVGNVNFGWISNGNQATQIQRIDYSSDLSSALPRSSLPGSAVAGISNADYGWVAGGTSAVRRLEFANDLVAATIRGPLTGVSYWATGAGNANYGWVNVGGPFGVPPVLSTMNRIDYSNDSPTSASPRGPLSSAKYGMAATGNASYGWFAGGGPSVIDRVDYSNDLVTASVRGPLSLARFRLGAHSNYVEPSLNQFDLQRPFIGNRVDGTFGWFIAGFNQSTVVERVDFANDSPTTGSLRSSLTAGRGYGGSVGNTNFGWVVGGGWPSQRSSVERINFANDLTTPAVRSPISSSRYGTASTGNANYGWTAGGAGVPGISTVQRIDFSNDDVSHSFRGNLTRISTLHSAAGNGNYGWWAGGFTTGGSIGSAVQRIDFSNDSPTSASIRGPMESSRFNLSGVSNFNYGWFSGSSTPSSIVSRIDFSNDSPTAASPRGPLSVSRNGPGAAGTANLGWFGGGGSTITDRIDFSNDGAASSVRGPLAEGGNGKTAVSNYVKTIPIFNVTQYAKGSGTVGTAGPGTFGWVVAGQLSGFPFPTVSTVDRIDFSNDSPTTASSRGNLTMVYHIGVNDANYGWFGGTQSTSNINRIDYANDSPSPAGQRSSLTNTRQSLGGASNSNYGWFVGGTSPGNIYYTSVDRLDFANDAATAISRGGLTLQRQDASGAGNASYGWFGGGFTVPGAVSVSTVDRIDYSNDLANAIVRGPLSSARYTGAATSNANYGWWAGGGSPGNFFSIVNRIDFSNDSPTAASPRGTLAQGRGSKPGASGNANYGWFSGGLVFGFPTSIQVSTVERIDYANDSPTTASIRGPLVQARALMASTSNYVK